MNQNENETAQNIYIITKSTEWSLETFEVKILLMISSLTKYEEKIYNAEIYLILTISIANDSSYLIKKFRSSKYFIQLLLIYWKHFYPNIFEYFLVSVLIWSTLIFFILSNSVLDGLWFGSISSAFLKLSTA